jgi:predicted DNA-binding transcriptional regulator AlpA
MPIGTDTHPAKLLDVRQVAELFGCSRRQVWRLAASGAIPEPIRLASRTVRWRERDLLRHLDALADQAS